MLRIVFGIFIVLHGFVHLLYFGQSAQYFELQPGMDWPDGAWAISKLLGDGAVRNLANFLLILAALLFVVGGSAVLARQDWWRQVAIGAAVFSTLIYFLLWNGKFEHLDNNGWVGILINLVILVVVILFQWPEV